MIEGYKWQQEQRQQELTVLAWATAALVRSKKLPRLEKLLKTNKPEKSPEQAKREFEVLMSEMGGGEDG